MTVDSLGFGDALVRPARAARGRARGRRARSPRAALPDAGDVRQRRRARHGRLGHRRRRARRPSAPRRCRCRSRCSSTTARPRSSAPRTLAFAVSYSGDTEETLEMARGALAAGATLVAISQRRRARDARGASRARCTCRAPTASRCRGLALGALVAPLFVVLFRMGMLPEAHAGAAARAAAARAPARPVHARRRRRPQPGARAGAQDRPHDPARLRQRRPRRRGGAALEAVDERERQGAGVLERVPRARPQRDLRLGSARRRHPPGVHAGRAAPRLRAPAARARASAATRELIEEALRAGARGRGRGGGPPRAAARPHRTSATGRATTSRSTTTSTPARSTPSSQLKAVARLSTVTNASLHHGAECTREWSCTTATGAPEHRRRGARHRSSTRRPDRRPPTSTRERHRGTDRAELGRAEGQVGGAVGARALAAVGPARRRATVRCSRGGSRR